MKKLLLLILAVLMLPAMTACDMVSTAKAEVPAATTVAAAALLAPTAAPAPTEALTQTAAISGVGIVAARQTADLVFPVNGVVSQVLVAEGDQVQAGAVLAKLDISSFDLDVQRAEAALTNSQAQQSALAEGPRAADIAAAEAQLAQAQAALAQILTPATEQDLAGARAAVTAAEANLQATRDKLSAAKTNAGLQVEQAANTLRNAQDSYSRIYWQNRELEKLPGDLPQAAKDSEDAALRAVQNGEAAVQQAQLAYDQAVDAEQTGIQAAEQQLIQARSTLEKLLLPPNKDRVAQVQAQVAAAQAQRDRLNPAPNGSQRNQAAAGVESAQAALDLAKLNRERAELRAPFAGTIAVVNVAPGESSATGSLPAVQIIDSSELHVDLQINDADISNVQVGQAARLTIDAAPGKLYSGRVSYIAPTATVSGNVRTYLVRISLADQEGLRIGMRVRVELG